MNLSMAEKEMLLKIKNSKRFPVVRFELRSTKDRSLLSIALNHVWLTDINDSMETVKANAAVLQKLQDNALIHIRYSVPAFVKSDYTVYYESKIYELLRQTVEDGKQKPHFIFDTPFIKRGIVSLTERGQALS